jgi:hypothetical protein
MSAIEILAAAAEDGWGDYDGLYTLFNLQIGNDTQKQNFRFVPSTSSFTTWLPLYERCGGIIPLAANYSLFPTDLTVCAEECGVGYYDGNQNIGFNASFSTSYKELDTETMDLGSITKNPADIFGTMYDAGSAAAAGVDLVSLQVGNNSWYQAPKRTVTFGVDSLLYILPTLGLGFGEIVSHLGTYPSFMDTVTSTSVIPSRSWGYTAGANYRTSTSPSLYLCVCCRTTHPKHNFISFKIRAQNGNSWSWLIAFILNALRKLTLT